MRVTILLLFISVNFIIGQEAKNEKSNITFIKSKKVSKTFNARAHTLIKGKNTKRVMVRCKIIPSNNQMDINSFSLIDSINKLRYRLSDISAYYVYGGPKINQYLIEKPYNKKGEEIEVSYAKYDPSIKDSFLDYEFKGYKICESKFPFSSGQRISTYYGVVESKKKFTIDLFFDIPKDLLEHKGYELYFGDQKIKNIEF
ncbi:hypothetical protein BUL40_09695 [Croceivirga radicis]|uniref:DUF3857 domain-containing protein n=1 Tax=Croceivirga radicis TaxID=1929488 RepID=A0A1V6LRF8_9FLAO|nr:hypothetical protein [Croceivirga radicis]OQD42780.1 hypothetical protein BUL40_09695 [Croceivirga radicis]